MKKYPIKELPYSRFPQLLKEINDPPKKLFYRGNINVLKNTCISIVGSRKITSYGKQCISFFIPKLSKHFTIVSGLAFGVDSLTHQTTLQHNGNTIAVLPSGLDEAVISPRRNLKIAQQILDNNGLLLSEYSSKTQTQKWHFAARNRIIAGLSSTTLLIEAAMKSGSLITAHHARDYNRNVAIIPGNIFSDQSTGCHSLLCHGAYPITTPQDILNLYNISENSHIQNVYTPVNLAEELILKHITQYPVTIDKIYNSCKLEAKLINSTLGHLELKGVIKNNYTGIYLLK